MYIYISLRRELLWHLSWTQHSRGKDSLRESCLKTIFYPSIHKYIAYTYTHMHTQVEITFPLRNAEDLKGSHPFNQMALKKVSSYLES